MFAIAAMVLMLMLMNDKSWDEVLTSVPFLTKITMLRK